MKILYIWSENDYEAADFEATGMSVKEAIEILESGQGITMGDDDEDYKYVLPAKVLEFGEVDPAFIKFIRSFQDCDDSKHTNFYVLEE